MTEKAWKSETAYCDECGSIYLKSASKMKCLCPECSHILYGYENCKHEFINGRCSKCLWDGSSSKYIRETRRCGDSNNNTEHGEVMPIETDNRME